MRISDAFPSNYLKASDLQGRAVTVTIDRIAMEEIAGGEHKPVIYFQGKDKGVVLNKTNANNISALYGDDTDQWSGKQVELFSAWVDFQGKSVEAIRMRRPPNGARPAAPPPKQEYSERNPPPFNDSADIPF